MVRVSGIETLVSNGAEHWFPKCQNINGNCRPWVILDRLHWKVPLIPPNLKAVSWPLYSTQSVRNQLVNIMAFTNSSFEPLRCPSHAIRRRLGTWILWWTSCFGNIRCIPWFGWPPVMIVITLTGRVSKIDLGHLEVTPKTSNAPLDLSMPHIPWFKLMPSLTKADCSGLNTFLIPPDTLYTIKSMGPITSCWNGDKFHSPHQTVEGFSICETW